MGGGVAYPPLPRCNRATPAGGRLSAWLGGIARATSPQVAARRRLAAGARLGADWGRVPLLTARWLYTGVRQGTREMQRVGLTMWSPRAGRPGILAAKLDMPMKQCRYPLASFFHGHLLRRPVSDNMPIGTKTHPAILMKAANPTRRGEALTCVTRGSPMGRNASKVNQKDLGRAR